MFTELLGDYLTWSPAALDNELRRLELAARELDARRLAVRAAAENTQTFAVDGHTSVKAYLRATTNQPSAVALAETRRARLCRDFPEVGEALISGRIGVGQIDEIVRIARNPRAVAYLDDAQVAMLVGHAEHLSIRNLAKAVDHWLLWADPDGAWRDETESVEHRAGHVAVTNGGVSVSAIGGDVLTAEALTKIFEHFVAIEFRKDCETRRAECGDRADEYPLPRTDAQRRFDAIVAIFQLAYVATGDGSMPDPVVNIVCDQRTLHDLMGRAGIALANVGTVDLEALTRHQIDAMLAEFVRDPSTLLTRRCETSSGHPLPPQLLIQALLTAQVRRVVLDARSTVIDLGERKRLFTGNARIAATLLEQYCRHPGCEVLADSSQIDHNQSHTDGGTTDQRNAGPMCGSHNRFKYRNGWRTRRADNGRIYNIRSDGTLVLFVGERPPQFTIDDDHERRQAGLAHLEQIRQRLQHEAA